MNTVTAILEPDADGSIHLALPKEMQHAKVKVVATLAESPGDAAVSAKVKAVREWAKHSRGSVRLEPGETTDDVRMAYYAGKYGQK